MKLFVTVLYSYSNENAITSQVLEFKNEAERDNAIAQLEHAYSYRVTNDSGYKVICVKV
jgi:hypothetical protein